MIPLSGPVDVTSMKARLGIPPPGAFETTPLREVGATGML